MNDQKRKNVTIHFQSHESPPTLKSNIYERIISIPLHSNSINASKHRKPLNKSLFLFDLGEHGLTAY